MLKMKVWIPLIIVLFCSALSLLSCANDQEENDQFKLVSKDVGPFPRWSKDGKALYYTGDEGRFCRYDLATGKKKGYKAKEPFQKFDVSPDEKFIVYAKEDAIVRVDLASHETKTLHSVQIEYSMPEEMGPINDIQDVFWLTQNQILFTQRTARYYEDAYLIKPSGGRPEKIMSSTIREAFSALDGSRLAYRSDDHRYHVYSIKDRKDTHPALGDFTVEEQSLWFKFLSDKLVVYMKEDFVTEERYVYEAIDLSTGKIEKLDELNTIHIGGISPDLSKGFFVQLGQADWYSHRPTKLYLVDIPPATIQKLRAMQGK